MFPHLYRTYVLEKQIPNSSSIHLMTKLTAFPRVSQAKHSPAKEEGLGITQKWCHKLPSSPLPNVREHCLNFLKEFGEGGL